MVSEGVHDINMWKLMLTVDLLKHGIPDPSSLNHSYSHSSSLVPDKENIDKVMNGGEEYLPSLVFVHTKLRDEDLTPHTFVQLRKALAQYFKSSSLTSAKCRSSGKETHSVSCHDTTTQSDDLNLFTIPFKNKDDSPVAQYQSYNTTLWKLRDQILSMNSPSFARTVSERDWLKNSAKIWELVKNSPIITEYSRTLQNSGLFRR